MKGYGKKIVRGYRKARRVAGKVKKFADKVNRNKYVRGASSLYSLGEKVAMLTHLVNVEKKRSDITVMIAQPFGRSNGGSDGAYHAIISPTIIQGITGDERIGNSIKLVSGCLDVSIEQQVNAINSIKIKLWIICRPENAGGYSASNTLNQLLEINPFTQRRDYYSNRDAEYFSEFRVIKCLNLELKQDQISTGTARIQKKIPLKLNHHQKFNTDGSSVSTKNQFYLIATASDGEMMSPSLTGAQIQYNMRWYYTDN